MILCAPLLHFLQIDVDNKFIYSRDYLVAADTPFQQCHFTLSYPLLGPERLQPTSCGTVHLGEALPQSWSPSVRSTFPAPPFPTRLSVVVTGIVSLHLHLHQSWLRRVDFCRRNLTFWCNKPALCCSVFSFCSDRTCHNRWCHLKVLLGRVVKDGRCLMTEAAENYKLAPSESDRGCWASLEMCLTERDAFTLFRFLYLYKQEVN